ncbi:autotransporter outer membrane beta-barrel domain-containing protein [Phascolarctobacterium succinatutens]|uniref:autotransporter outer membrane beta-barrel domain-containing protein n=1 Tax=Phascolarctobacterium succinatutens TaxID=626940 RepID=UPI00307D18CD
MDCCAPGGVLVVPSAWAADYYGNDGVTKVPTGANVTLNSDTYSNVYGGYNEANVAPPDVSQNTVSISGTTTTDIVFGGYSLYGNSKENTVTISGNTMVNIVVGGNSGENDAIKNYVIIQNKSEIKESVYGGYAKKKSDQNIVEISDSKIKEHVYGAYAALTPYGSAEKNSVKVGANSIVEGNVYGAHVTQSAKENIVTVNSAAKILKNVYGGYSDTMSADSNQVIIEGAGIVEDSVYGGYAEKDNSNNNQVTVDGAGTVKGTVFGGYAKIGSVNNNQVTVDGAGTVKDTVFGAFSEKGNTTGNVVNIRGNSVIGDDTVIPIKGAVVGGFALEGISSGNTVNIANSKVFRNVYGAFGGNDCTGNIINITGSEIGANVYGGQAEKGNSLGNTVSIENSTVTENVYGGYAQKVLAAKAENNKVILKNGAKIKGDVYGGYAVITIDSQDGIKNNTLEVVGKGNEAKSIQNFDKLNFFITKDLIANDTMLKVTDTALINNAEIKAGVELGTKLNENDKINLITAGALKAENITTGTLTDGLINIDKGIKVAIGPDGNKLVGVINGTTPPGGGGTTPPGGGGTTPPGGGGTTPPGGGGTTPPGGGGTTTPGGGGTTPGAGSLYAAADAKSPVETQSAALTMLNLGHDLLTTAGYENAALAVDGEEEGSVNPFITMSANNQKIDTGSHVDLKAWNMNLGFAKKINNNSGKLIIAPVIEYGRGSYDSYLDNGTHGDGDAHFWGAGLMAKQLNDDGLYYEGSLRAGRMSTDYQSAVAGGIKYDSDATYYAAHLGMGKVVQLNDKDTIDYYGKLFYTRQQGDKVTVGTGATYDFDATTSLRTRLGARYTHQLSEKNAFYAGLAWQHEFDGESNAIVATTLGSASAPAPSMKGDTGIMELGWRVNNSDKFELGLGVNGSVGKQKGVGFNLSLNFSF